jgi:integrase
MRSTRSTTSCGGPEPRPEYLVGTSLTAGGTATPRASSGRDEDIHVVQRLMGHSNIATTSRYLHLSDADLIDAVNRAFPGS